LNFSICKKKTFKEGKKTAKKLHSAKKTTHGHTEKRKRVIETTQLRKKNALVI